MDAVLQSDTPMHGSIGVQKDVVARLFMTHQVKIMFVLNVRTDAQKRNYYEK